jgi:quercetin dioxygenase-like cupin family protein
MAKNNLVTSKGDLREPAMKIFDYKDVGAVDAEEGASGLKIRWLITKEMGAENFAMRLFEMVPSGHSPLHSHPWEHEVYILQGEGIVLGKDGEKVFRPGSVVFIPATEKHQFRNTGTETVRFLCIIPIKRI